MCDLAKSEAARSWHDMERYEKLHPDGFQTILINECSLMCISLYMYLRIWNDDFVMMVLLRSQNEMPQLCPKDGGSLVMFRSDMPHEVLPTFAQRFALSMWCHDET